MSLEQAQSVLGWPSPQEVLYPTQFGASILAEQARKKLGTEISRLAGGSVVRVGVLVPDAGSTSTDSPVALVCEFSNVVPEQTLRAAHRLAWNFCKAPLLLTLDPVCVKAWSCCVPPDPNFQMSNAYPAEVPDARVDWQVNDSATGSVLDKLHWIMLASGQFFDDFRNFFRVNGRADQVLLQNLRFIRNKLHDLELPDEISHDLIGRIIFMQFLSQRKDSNGEAALNSSVLSRLSREKILGSEYSNISDVLHSYVDTYQLFRWLNERFNGDLFPGKGATGEERESEWQYEMSKVKQIHLTDLADFVSGEMMMEHGQRCLFPLYSFDTIPLELISSIYEEFVSKDKSSVGAHYTPGHLVDFILDGVLPWQGTEWNIKILDPSCGSGIFLVKAYQRLITRWKTANHTNEIEPSVLRSLLQHNLFGVDNNPLAVRVASFSLYLAMCDEIDPRRYWTQVNFPRLRNISICEGDYFGTGTNSLNKFGKVFDLVVGNAPWGKNSLSENAKEWANKNAWPTVYNSIGPLFLPKVMELVKSTATVSMLQPVGLLMNRVQAAAEFRRKLFTKYRLQQVVNLAGLRFGLFKKAVSPACIVTLSPEPPDDSYVTYICPKPSHTSLDDYRMIIDSYDVQSISPDEAALEQWIWTVLMWGGRRDVSLIRRLSSLPTLSQFKVQKIAKVRQGVIRGDRKKINPDIIGRAFVSEIPENTFLNVKLSTLPLNNDANTHSRDSQDMTAFNLPQLLVKQGWRKAASRFQAILVEGNGSKGALCSKSYFSVHVPAKYKHILEAACLSGNSTMAVYFMLMTSARFASYRPEPNVEDLLKVPLITLQRDRAPTPKTNEDVDARVLDNLGLRDSERALIEDVVDFTLPDFKGDHRSAGRKSTLRSWHHKKNNSQLITYCEWFLRVLRAGFGKSKQLGATVYEDAMSAPMPFRMIAIRLESQNDTGVKTVRIPSTGGALGLAADFLSPAAQEKHRVLYKRVARFYTVNIEDGIGAPTVYIIKPDQIRYWTRSMAIRDADEVALDILQWNPPMHMDNLRPSTKSYA